MDIFAVIFFAFLAIGLLFPIAVATCLPRDTKPGRWIQNCPAFSVFMLSAFPIAMSVFAVTMRKLKQTNGIDVFAAATFGTPTLLYGSIAVLVCLLVFTSIMVLYDFTSRPVGPYVLRGAMAVEAFALEKELRDAARTSKARARARRRSSRKRGAARKAEPVAIDLGEKIRRYQALVHLKSLRDVFAHGNLVAAAYLGVAWVGTMCCVFYFWYVGVLVLTNQTLPAGTISQLLTIFILLITWFPMRVHLDWYQNHFHNRDWLKQSNGFWLGIALAVASLIFVVFIANPDSIAIVCAVLNALILLFVGVAGKFKPQLLRSLAETLQSMPFVYFFGGYLIFLIVTFAIGIRILYK